MLRYLKQQKVSKTAIWGLFLSIVVLIVPLVCGAYTTFFVEDFETYELGALAGQNGWSSNGIVGNTLPPYEYPVRSGEKSISKGAIKSFSSNSNGIISIWIWLGGGASSQGLTLKEGEVYLENMRISLIFYDCLEPVYCKLRDGLDEFIANVDKGKWQNIQLRWADKKWAYNLNDTGWSAQRNFFDTSGENIDNFRVDFATGTYLDNIGVYVPFLGRVWGITPVSGTEITSADTSFSFGWEDLEVWDTLSVVFQNEDTGIFTEAKEYIIETVSPSGQESLYFSDFNFDRNGIYHFFATATRTAMEIVEGMYLTGRYSYEWSDDLVDPEFWYTINIEGFEPIFEMSDFFTWYGSVSKFATPTDMFVSIAGFFEPTFNKIGEFGNRIKDYFNLSEVYSQGYEIGKTIPYFSYFVGQISLFLGGFPVLKWVFVVILLLTGIFIFRLVLKFIPGLG